MIDDPFPEDEGNEKLVLEYIKGSMDVRVHELVRHIHPKRKLVIFVSSHFSDMKLERQLLHEKVLPIAQTVAWEDNIEVILHDPRYWISSEEAVLDNLIWEKSREAIEIASQESDGIFFLSLLGDKYGTTLLPKYLPKELLVETCKGKQEKYGNLVKLAFEWYLLNENHIPPRYELKPITCQHHYDYLDFSLPKLSQELLSAVCFERFSNFEREGLQIGESLIEWESLKALTVDPKRCLFLNRTFSPTTLNVSTQHHLDLCDTIEDNENLKRLQNLQSTILHHYALVGGSSPFYHAFNSISIDDYLNSDSDDHDRYFKEYECYLVNFFTREIMQVKKKSEQWSIWLHQKFNLSDDFFQEIMSHHSMALEKASSYSACLDWVEACYRMIHPNDKSTSGSSMMLSPSPEISLAIVGSPGSGKSTLLSKIACALKQMFPDIPLLIRFCGTSKYSLNAMDLIQSLSIQLLSAYQLQEELTQFTREMPLIDYPVAVTIFQSLLTKYPVFVLLDGIEELSDLYAGRSQLSFLQNFQPHPQTRILLTVIGTPSPTLSSSSSLSAVFCERVLVEKQVPRFVIDLTDRIEDSLAILLQSKNKLQLQPKQWEFVKQNLPKTEIVANLFYLSLLTYYLRDWKSFEETFPYSSPFPGTIPTLIHRLFESYERIYGQKTISFLFGFYAYSKKGLTDIELRDCLSLQEEVLRENAINNLLPSFPMARVQEIKQQIKSFLQVKNYHLNRWSHHLFWQIARERYASIRKQCHEVMGYYFCNLIGNRMRSQRKIQEQPLTFHQIPVWFPQSKVNLRRLIEGYYHLLKAEIYKEAVEELLNLENIYAAVVERYDPFFLDLTDLAMDENEVISEDYRQALKDFSHWIKKVLPELLRHSSPREKFFPSLSKERYASTARTTLFQYLEVAYPEKRNPAWHWPEQEKIFLREVFLCSPSPTTTSSTTSSFSSSKKKLISQNCIGHLNIITGLSWNPDRSQFVSSSKDNTLRIWDIATGNILQTIENTEQFTFFTSVDWNLSGDIIASGSTEIQFWQVSDGMLLGSVAKNMNALILELCWHPTDISLLAFLRRSDRRIHIWHYDKQKERFSLEGPNFFTAIAWSLNGNRLASSDTANKIIIWDTAKGEVLRLFNGHLETIHGLAWNKDDQHLVSYSTDGSIKVWDSLTRAKCLQKMTIASQSKDTIWKAATWDDHQKVIAGSQNGDLVIFDGLAGKRISLYDNVGTGITSILWNPMQAAIVTGLADGSIKIWDMKQLEKISNPSSRSPDFEEESIQTAIWNHRGNQIAIGYTKKIELWNLSEGALVSTLEGHEKRVTHLQYYDNDQFLASIGGDQVIKIWDVTTEELVITLEGHRTSIKSLAWHRKYPLLASGSKDGAVKIWSLDSLQQLPVMASSSNSNNLPTNRSSPSLFSWILGSNNTLERNTFWFNRYNQFENMELHWSTNGSETLFIAGAGAGTVLIVDATNGQILTVFKGFVKDSHIITWNSSLTKIVSVSNGDRNLCLWNAKTGGIKLLVNSDVLVSAVHLITWHPDGSKLATASSDCHIRIWNLKPFVCLFDFPAHETLITCLCFSDGGSKLLSASKDTVKVWDLLVLR